MSIDLGEYGLGARRPQPLEPALPSPVFRRSQLPLIPLALALAGVCLIAARDAAERAPAASPLRVALGYLTAVAANDAAGARANVVPPPADVVLYGAAELGQQGGLSGLYVESTHSHGGSAVVRIDFAIAGILTHADLVLRGTRVGWLQTRRWRIVGGVPTLRIRAPAYEPVVVVDGATVRLRGGRATVALFPGIIDLQLPEHGTAGATFTTTAVVDGSSALTLQPGISAAARVAAITAVEDELGSPGATRADALPCRAGAILVSQALDPATSVGPDAASVEVSTTVAATCSDPGKRVTTAFRIGVVARVRFPVAPGASLGVDLQSVRVRR